MAQIKYRIVTVSSQDTRYKASNLMNDQQEPWITAKSSTYPQQITIQFPALIKTKTLQITSHQYKISSKIQVFIKSSQQSLYRRLGHFIFSSNKKSGFKRREIKTVYFQFPCLFLRLVFARNYPNDYNVFNQIGIQSLKVAGHYQIENTNSSYLSLSDVCYPQNKEIQKLEKQMRNEAKNQNYEQAARIKKIIQRLKKSEDQLNRLQKLKEEAKQRQDYDRCALLKAQISALKNSCQSQNNSIYSQKNAQIGYYINQSILRQSDVTNSKIYQQPLEQIQQVKKNLIKGQNQINNNKPADYDSLIIPTLRQKKQTVQQFQLPKQQSPTLQPLQHKNLALIQIHLPIFDQNLWAHIFSEYWKFRQKGLKDIKQKLSKNQINLAATGLFNAIFQAVYRTISDRNINVIQASSQLLQLAAIDLQLPSVYRPQFHSQIYFVVQSLVQKLADTNTKLRDCCLRVMLRLPSHPAFDRSSCINAITSNKKKGSIKSNTKLLVAKTKLLIQLLKQEKAYQQFFESAIKFAQNYVQHPSIDVRQSINDLIYMLAAQNGVQKVTPYFDKTRIGIKSVLSEKLKDLQLIKQSTVKAQRGRQRDIKKDLKYKQRQTTINNEQENEYNIWPPPLSSVHHKDIQQKVVKKQDYYKKLDFIKYQRDRLQRSKQYESNFFKDIEQQDISQQIYQDYYDDSLKQSIDQTRRQFKIYSKQQQTYQQQCQYCGASDSKFVYDQIFNKHLMDQCMLVTRCQSCGSIVQVWQLTYHILNLCKYKFSYQQCSNCGIAVLAQQMPTHKLIGCNTKKNAQVADRCQLCSKDIIPPQKQSWRRHMLNGLCSGNNRGI